ncbi:MAG TPA: aminotransferase class I/II-fold pyridoxal phosphate-dependent enzyme [Candidatus Saccharimonadales bacterium]|jgi:aromatic-L-amino-acid decarboxylase|nr:aminotransferase class I/II-fold pyridoxal phosphate-dependent enzyme [Candidatus Saccharimonadales bacterium]
MSFAFDSPTRRSLGYRLIDRIDEYFSGLPGRRVQLPLEQRPFDDLTHQLPEFGQDAATFLDHITTELIDQGFHVPSANYFGLMNPTPAYMAVLAEALVAALNPQLASLARSQLASKIEREAVRWIGERVGWPGRFDGTFTSGGAEANFSAMALALASRFPAVVEDGIAAIGARPVLYASAEAHHSIDKSAGLLGLGRKAVRRIAIDKTFRMDLQKLEAQIERDHAAGDSPFCLVATAGTTNSGAIDDLQALSAICRKHGLWLHVDGAYGAAVVFSNRHRDLVKGIELADSVTIDPHKWLAMPFACGVVLTSHPETLEQAFAIGTPYMPKAQGSQMLDNFKVSAQWSRRLNSLKFWLTLQVHGRQAYEELVHNQLELAGSFTQWIINSEIFELAVSGVLPIVNFRLKQPAISAEARHAAHEAIVQEVTRDGRRWISTTVVNGQSVIRMMVISYLTGHRQIEDLIVALTAAAKAYAPVART